MIKVLDLPYGKFRDKGKMIDTLSNFDSKVESFVYVSALEDIISGKLVFGTKQGLVKLVDGSEFNVNRKTSMATKLLDKDELLAVRKLTGIETMVFQSKKDYLLRIDCMTIPEQKKAAKGVKGMDLTKGDEVKEINILGEGENVEVEIKGKMVSLNRLHIAGRGCKGVKK